MLQTQLRKFFVSQLVPTITIEINTPDFFVSNKISTSVFIYLFVYGEFDYAQRNYLVRGLDIVPSK